MVVAVAVAKEFQIWWLTTTFKFLNSEFWIIWIISTPRTQSHFSRSCNVMRWFRFFTPVLSSLLRFHWPHTITVTKAWEVSQQNIVWMIAIEMSALVPCSHSWEWNTENDVVNSPQPSSLYPPTYKPAQFCLFWSPEQYHVWTQKENFSGDVQIFSLNIPYMC